MSLLHAASLIEPVWPLPVVNEPEKFTVPKFASGSTVHRMKHDDGASATHSAEVFAADESVCVVVNVAPVVTLVMVRVNDVPTAETSALIVLPGVMVIERLTGGFGYI